MSSYLRLVYNTTVFNGVNKAENLERIVNTLKSRCEKEIDCFNCMGWAESLKNLEPNNLHNWLLDNWNIAIGFNRNNDYIFNFVGEVYNSEFVKILLETLAPYLEDGLIVIVNVDYEYTLNYKVVNGELLEG